MFLKELTPEEKEAFIGLCVHAASANDIVEETEFEMIEEYCREMGIAFFNINKAIDFDRVVKLFSDSEPRHKKIVFNGIVGLLNADGSYDKKEKEFALDFAYKIGLTEHDVMVHSDLMERYIRIVRKISDSL